MTSVRHRAAETDERRKKLTRAVRDSLRDLSVQLGLLNQRVGDQLDLRACDLQCLDIIDRFGPLSPGALARQTGIHPATLTGVIDRLERGGWVTRERDQSDRRAVTVRSLRERSGQVLRLYGGMQRRVGEICADLDVSDLEVIAAFLRRTSEAGRGAVDDFLSE